ncbi:hypothetical protein CDAR_209551, partial [Caerostris darwini]
IFNTILYYCVL